MDVGLLVRAAVRTAAFLVWNAQVSRADQLGSGHLVASLRPAEWASAAEFRSAAAALKRELDAAGQAR